jgi:hypothetical protein
MSHVRRREFVGLLGGMKRREFVALLVGRRGRSG